MAQDYGQSAGETAPAKPNVCILPSDETEGRYEISTRTYGPILAINAPGRGIDNATPRNGAGSQRRMTAEELGASRATTASIPVAQRPQTKALRKVCE
jgi:hypothetical protein